MDLVEQFRFIADFADMDLEQMREGDWINLQEDLAHFLPTQADEGFTLFDAEEDPEAKKYPKPKIVELQKVVRYLLPSDLAGWDTTSAIAWHELHPRDNPLEIKITASYETFPGGVLYAHGKFRDMFFLNLVSLRQRRDVVSKVKRCPECNRIFYRVRRQKYCSGPCVTAANKREWLKTPKGQKYLRKWKKRSGKSRGKQQQRAQPRKGRK